MPVSYQPTPVGFQRVYKAPLDDKEIFSSNADLLAYCSDGAAYNGQRVAINYADHTQECIIKRTPNGDTNVPILIFSSDSNLVVKTINNKLYALIYYINTFVEDDTKVFSSFTPTKFPSGKSASFSLMDQIQILSNTTEAANFYFKGLLETTSFESTFSQVCPIYGNPGSVGTKNTTNQVTKLRYTANDSNGYIETTNSGIYLMNRALPNNACFELYVELGANYASAGGFR